MKMETDTLKDLFVEELQDLYSAENQLVKALPKMAKAATSSELKKGFEMHLKETKGHVERLDKIFKMLDEKSKGPKCKAMEGLVEEGKEIMEEHDTGELLDAGLIAAAQKVEHYEIASYGTVKAWAGQMGLDDVAELLNETLEEEKATDEKLTEMALASVNTEAMAK
jgi:ferritin-like metal-binding protein YciE